MKINLSRPLSTPKLERTPNNVIITFDSKSLQLLHRYDKERAATRVANEINNKEKTLVTT